MRKSAEDKPAEKESASAVPEAPLEPALPVHRDCFIFDFRTNYVPGPISPSQWLPPPNTTCTPRTPSGEIEQTVV